MKLWGKDKQLDPAIEAFTVGDDPVLDQRLVRYDCRASIAHADMLKKIGILSADEFEQLKKALQHIIELDEKGRFVITREQEDCHTAIENHLTKKLGDLGKKIHTARSRNDQVLAALRLYYKDALQLCEERIKTVIQALRALSGKYGDIRFPGYTHTRKAMVSSIRMWAGGFEEAMEDNIRQIRLAFDLINQSPLGTGAGYGIPLEIDREYTAALLCFSRIQESPVYTQISRGKFEAVLIHTMSQILYDLNRMASDIIFFTLPELGYMTLPDAFCTGSSIMPQKKNPDVLELMRARYHVVISNEFQVKSMAANLISGYHRDLQLTKKPVMESIDITVSCLSIISPVIENLAIDADRCRAGLTEEIHATEKVYELVRQGMPFREAYRKIAERYK